MPSGRGAEPERDGARTRGEHYFAASPAASHRAREVVLTLDGVAQPIVLGTDRSVFSPGAVDEGTRFLLERGTRPDPSVTTLADVGCGYGPIAIALAHWAPTAEVWAVDVNERARQLCRDNAARAGVGDRVRVVAPDDVPGDLRVDELWSNPPIRVGKEALHDLLVTWLRRLPDRGAAHLVVHKHLGSDSLARWLAEHGWAVDRRRSRRGYRLLDVRAADRSGSSPPVDRAQSR
ncbi:MAG: methyltransferase [Actinobacteria bacterium]|nr:methyltransferase [Actinomycetota bacterium]